MMVGFDLGRFLVVGLVGVGVVGAFSCLLRVL